MQKVLFPGTHMRITQDELSTYSHAGSYARDDGGESTSKDSPVLAPFDGYVARVRTGSSHETYFVSDGPVEWANGYQGVTTFLFMHDNLNRVRQGQRCKQGDIIGYEGGFGDGRKDKFAHHTHREWAKGKQTTQSRNSRGTWSIGSQAREYDVCFVRPETMMWTGKAWRAAKDFAGAVGDNFGHVFRVLAPTADKPCRVQITGGPLNVRTGASTARPAICQVQQGDTFPVADQDAGWYFIELGTGGGWVSGDYASPVSAEGVIDGRKGA